jgi:hypothetical protein
VLDNQTTAIRHGTVLTSPLMSDETTYRLWFCTRNIHTAVELMAGSARTCSAYRQRVGSLTLSLGHPVPAIQQRGHEMRFYHCARRCAECRWSLQPPQQLPVSSPVQLTDSHQQAQHVAAELNIQALNSNPYTRYQVSQDCCTHSSGSSSRFSTRFSSPDGSVDSTCAQGGN